MYLVSSFLFHLKFELLPENPENPKIRIDPVPKQSGFSDFYSIQLWLRLHKSEGKRKSAKIGIERNTTFDFL
jgi:hypothetical protein